MNLPAAAWFGGQIGTQLLEVTDDVAALESEGRWAVLVTFEGEVTLARFGDWRPGSPAELAGRWVGPQPTAYSTSLDRDEYQSGVRRIRKLISMGQVYQANICRTLSARMPSPQASDVFALAALLERGNPAPFASALRLPDHGVNLACASPELYIARAGARIESSPIKGTAETAEGLTDKDRAENVMIVDLVRNDLGRVCEVGSIEVPSLLRVEQHPTLVHLVSTVSGRLAADAGWPEIFAGTFPPGSVTGAPKSSALTAIAALEAVPRGPYCGAIGWVDADAGTAELAVGIRSFWLDGDELNFGTGAGITWGSDPAGEWAETELKAGNLVRVASQTWD